MLAILLTTLLWADCKIPAPRYTGDACTISVDQVDQIGEYYKCRQNRKSLKTCIESSQKDSGPLQNLSFFLSPALLKKLSESEAKELVEQFFRDNENDLANTLAEDMHRQDYAKKPTPPPWNRNMSNAELDALPQDRSSQYSRLSDLQNEHKRLQIQARSSQKELVLLRRFERRYEDYIRAADLQGGSWNKINEPNVHRWVDGNRSVAIDIANTPWKNIPDEFNYQVGPGVYKNLKETYRNTSRNQLQKVKYHILNGGTLDDLKSTFPTMSDHNRNFIVQHIRVAGTSYRAEIEGRNLSFSNLRGGLNNRARISNTKRLRRIRLAGGALSVASLAISVAMVYVEQQASCDRTFPFYPTNYEEPAVPGLPIQSKCQMTMPDLDNLPKEVRSFLNLTYEEKDYLLNASSGGHSPCGYYRQAYNHIFCNQLTEEELSPETPTEY